MTKFIVHGGNTSTGSNRGREFFEAMIEGIEKPRILECLFAREESDWENSFAKDREFVAEHFHDRNVQFELANVDTFIEQIKATDIVFFRGGRTKRLIERLEPFPNFSELFDTKTIVGSSAGANMLARYYYGLDDPGLRKGLGILPIKVLVHYRSDYNTPNIDWDKAETELRSTEPEISLITLAEGQFEVLHL